MTEQVMTLAELMEQIEREIEEANSELARQRAEEARKREAETREWFKATEVALEKLVRQELGDYWNSFNPVKQTVEIETLGGKLFTPVYAFVNPRSGENVYIGVYDLKLNVLGYVLEEPDNRLRLRPFYTVEPLPRAIAFLMLQQKERAKHTSKVKQSE